MITFCFVALLLLRSSSCSTPSCLLTDHGQTSRMLPGGNKSLKSNARSHRTARKPISSSWTGTGGACTMVFSPSGRDNALPVAAILVLHQIICAVTAMPFSSGGVASNLPSSAASNAYAAAAARPPISTSAGRCRSAILSRRLFGVAKDYGYDSSSSLFELRGGASMLSDDDEEYDLDDSSSEDEESDMDLDDESSDEEETDEEADGDAQVATSSSPVKLIISTGLGCSLIDQTLETNASRSRTIGNIRQTISRQMKGRPPLQSVRLLLGNRVLRDDEIIDDLAPDEDDEDDELDDEEEAEEEEDDGMVKLRLTLDAVPPVDPKFGVELQEQLQKMSTAELLEAYAANAAAAHEGVARMFASSPLDDLSDSDDDEEEDDEEESIGGRATTSVNTAIRQHALSIKETIVETMPQDAIAILHQSADESEGAALASAVASARRHRRGGAMKGGASTQVKRALQRNLNINWADTIRNFVLFLFFGYFGGRDPLSRSIMYLGAPLCFVLQARPVKIAMKQLFYTVGKPPAILLSLLPAPQQAIMSLNYGAAMADLYGKEGVALGAASGRNGGGDDDDINEEDDDEGEDWNGDGDSDESDPYDDDYDEYDEY